MWQETGQANVLIIISLCANKQLRESVLLKNSANSRNNFTLKLSKKTARSKICFCILSNLYFDIL